MKSYGNIVTRYDDMLYDSRPTTFNEFISDKYNRIHSELYNSALSKFYKDTVYNIIDSDFIYEYFNLISNTETINDVYEKYLKLQSDNTFKEKMNVLSLDSFSFLNDIYNKTSDCLEAIKKELLTETNNYFYFKNLINIIDDFRVTYVLNNIYLRQEESNPDDTEFLTYHYTTENGMNNPTEEYLFMSELQDYVIILEADSGIRISYKRNGEWFLILDGNSYRTLESKIFVINFINNINKELIDYIKDIAVKYYKKNHKVIEIKNSEYWQPSSIITISNVKPYKKFVFSLEKYWNMTQGYINTNVTDVKMINENIKDCEITSINYVTGKAIIRSRINDLEYEVPFSYLDNTLKVSDEMTLQNTFINKSKNNY